MIGTDGKKLVFWGALLFLLGLLEGALIPYFLNSRMGLSAHLAAVQSGLALMVFGAIWHLLCLSEKWTRIACYANIGSMYLVWIGISVSAFTGASRALPMAGAGFSANPVAEISILLIIYAGAGLGVLGATLLVFGLYRAMRT